MRERTRSYRFVLHCPIGSRADREADALLQRQEIMHDYVCALFRCKFEHHIDIFLYENRQSMCEAVQESSLDPFIIVAPGCIHAVHAEAETGLGYRSHMLLLLRKFFPQLDCLLLREGVAMFSERYLHGFPLAAWVQVIDQRGLYRSLQSLSRNDVFLSQRRIVSFPIAGSFIDYLFLTKGRERVISMLKTTDRDVERIILDHFKMSFDYLDEIILRTIRTLSIQPAMLSGIHQEFESLQETR